MPRYLLSVCNRNPTFVISDILACARYYNFSVTFENPEFQIGQAPNTGFVICLIDSDEDAIKLAKRCTSIQSVSRLLANAETFKEMLKIC